MPKRETFTTIRTEGALLPADLLQRIAAGQVLDYLTPEAYHLSGEKLNEAITRAWSRLTGAWSAFKAAREKLPEFDAGTTVTRERWLLPLFQELGYGRLQGAKAFEFDGKSYPVSHQWEKALVHLVSFRAGLDQRSSVTGATRMTPHGLLQELLNRSDDHLWGFVSNGLRLRILRNNTSLTRQAYVEFDLEAMMDGEVYADFALLWLLCHQSRVEGEKSTDCILERWSRAAQETGKRALDRLRDGVEAAITALGKGYLVHPANHDLRDALRSGDLGKQEYYRQVLRIVYRLIFLFVAEDRDLLLAPDADLAAKARYTRFYSTARLRRLAEKRRGTPHTDLGRMLWLVFRWLGEDGCPEVALPALGSYLWSREAVANIADCDITNHDLLTACTALAFTTEGNVRRPVDFRNLGSEELGSVYESLLELHPDVNTGAGAFTLRTAGGNERKTTGSYYTPSSLIQCLLDSALNPVLEEACRQPDPAQAILNLKVCDPAAGSGHFLVAAAHRMAKRLATIRTGDDEPSPEVIRHSLREVISHCIYAVDINPMAVELCKVSLWMEALEPGKPLSFLDAHIQCGDSLVGVSPGLNVSEIPDDAFTATFGDDKATASAIKKRNKDERSGQIGLDVFVISSEEELQYWMSRRANSLDVLPEETAQQVAQKARNHQDYLRSKHYLRRKLEYDLWTAAFFWKMESIEGANGIIAPTQEMLRRHRAGGTLPLELVRRVNEFSERLNFFHWELRFPKVFIDNNPGFDVVLGNPPWDMQEVKDNEFFAASYPEILAVTSAKEKEHVLARIKTQDPLLWDEYAKYVRRTYTERLFLMESGRYPLSGIGRLNLYRLFLENGQSILSPSGRLGMVAPSGFASDAFAQEHFTALHGTGRIASFYDFENREGLFPGVHRSQKFSLITITGGARATQKTDFVFYATTIADLSDATRHVPMSQDDLRQINPLSLTAPLFHSRRDQDITLDMQRRVPILADPAPTGWKIRPILMFMMNAAMTGHRTAEELEKLGFRLSCNLYTHDQTRWLPLLEGKMVAAYDHRASSIIFDPKNRVRRNQPVDTTIEEHLDPSFAALPMFWIEENLVIARCGTALQWFIGIKDVTSATNERTAIAALLPWCALTDSIPWLSNTHSAQVNACLLANLNSLPLDYVARQKVAGLHLRGHYLAQLPICTTSTYSQACAWCTQRNIDWIVPRALELLFTADDLQPFAHECGYDGPPFRWDEERRFLLRCELDAAYFHLYGIVRNDVDYIMETFPIVKRKNEARYGSYRTKETILQIYDAMTTAARTGQAYQTIIDPPPADMRVAHAPAPILAPAEPYHDTKQLFPRPGRERFVRDYLPHLVTLRCNQTYEFYLDTLVLATRPDLLRTILPDATQQQFDSFPLVLRESCAFPENQHLRPLDLRQHLVRERRITYDLTTGIARLGDNSNDLPELAQHQEQLFTFALEAADALHQAILEGSSDQDTARTVTVTRQRIDSILTPA